QSPSGAADTNGIRQFVVGTGGEDHDGYPAGSSPAANSQARNADTFGVLLLTLHPTSYDFSFRPVAGGTFTDKGSARCHNTTPAAADAYVSSVLADGPVGYWRLGEPPGSARVADASGNNRTGTVSGGVALGVTGAL